MSILENTDDFICMTTASREKLNKKRSVCLKRELQERKVCEMGKLAKFEFSDSLYLSAMQFRSWDLRIPPIAFVWLIVSNRFPQTDAKKTTPTVPILNCKFYHFFISIFNRDRLLQVAEVKYGLPPSGTHIKSGQSRHREQLNSNFVIIDDRKHWHWWQK